MTIAKHHNFFADGVLVHNCRAIAHWNADNKTVNLISREGQPIEQVPHINAAIRKSCLAARKPSMVFDGELYTHELGFGKIASALKRVKDQDQELVRKIQYHCYDIVDRSRDFFDRFVNDTDWLKKADPAIVRVETQPIANVAELMRFQALMISEGYEGAMLRNGLGKYEHKRSNSLVKVKTFLDAEFKVVGVTNGRGSYADCAVFKCVTAEGYPFDVTAPGTIPEKQQYLETPAKWIGRLLTVKYQELTDTARPVPRMPVALRFRK